MKALVRHKYGGPGVVRVEEVEQPALEDDRMLVRVHASSLNKADWHQLAAGRASSSHHPRRRAAPEERALRHRLRGSRGGRREGRNDLSPGDEVFGGTAAAHSPST